MVASAPLASGAALPSRTQDVVDAAASEAAAVDQSGCFPHAALSAAKRAKLLSLLVPIELGGEGATVSEAADVCFSVARACASSGMILAMHYAVLACVARHGGGSRWHEALLRRVAGDECLLASSTTEGSAGGDVRASTAPLVRTNGTITLDRAATVVSYGAQADAIVTTARRDPDSPASAQALVVFLKEDYSLAETAAWKTLGMRGTCSAAFSLKASASEEQILPVPYKTIHAQTMVPVSHLLWSSVWTGIAAAALGRAQAFLRASLRRGDGIMPPGTAQYTRASAAFDGVRARLNVGLADYERMRDEPHLLEAINTQTAFNLLKVEISEGALAVVSMAMRTTGLAGYREDGEFSVARHLRDVLSAPIMIHNERILANTASSALLTPTSTSLRPQ